MKNMKAYIAVCTAMFLFGMSFVWTTDLVASQPPFPPQSLSMFRMGIGSVALFLFLIATRRSVRIAKKDIKWFLLLALFEPFIYFLGENNGLRITQSPSIGSVILATVPVFTMLACFYVFKERPVWTNIVGVLCTIPGVGLVMFTGDFTLLVPLSGVLLLFMAAASTAGYAIIIRKLHHYSAITIVAFQNLTGAIYFLPLVLFFERETLGAVAWGWPVVWPLTMLAVFVSGGAFVLFVTAIKHIGITQANMFSALIPVITTVAAFLMGRETMSLQQIIGVGVVIGGVILSQYRPASR
ncbi:MAG: DMT family transporter [Prevotellaceae bacterium]|jgi:drug/metabolite transporter (DMT)-like permease|nr:DMT family transporter [Prevotellaceae bacterium]